MAESREVVIVGAGIVGLSIAWQLHRRGQKRILVLEKGAGVGEGSTGASSAICRYRYSTPEMIRLAKTGIDSYRDWPSFVGLANPRARFKNDGVLWFTGDDLSWADREHRLMKGFGIRSTVLDNQALAEAFPALNPCTASMDLQNPDAHDCTGEGRHLLELDGGYMDPVSSAQDLLEACREAGIAVRFNSRVEEVEVTGGRVSGLHLSDGEYIASGCMVNAAGPWCNRLYRSVGLDVPMPLTPTRIQMLYVNRGAGLPGSVPICVDMQRGIYFRSQNLGQQLLVGSVREEDERERVRDPDHYQTVADEDFRAEKLHLLQHRLPGLRLDRSVRDYCGLYTVNQTDVHPLLGALGPEGFYVANGFSGHGFKTAPAVGAILARLISGTTLSGEDSRDDNWLSPQRSPIQIATRSVLA